MTIYTSIFCEAIPDSGSKDIKGDALVEVAADQPLPTERDQSCHGEPMH
ncbi:hypothetical protein CyaNS01_01916 [Cyanobium sp. NS01]|nr:hypothetical protein CyaNS01_01916 [Cyanobium sp. NS01]